MRKRICCCLLVLTVIVSLLHPLRSSALTPLDTQRTCTLNLVYSHAGTGFRNLEICLYRIAEASEDGTYELIPPYSGYPVNIHDISTQAEWKTVASTLNSYISADQIQPYLVKETDDNGAVLFTGLETGLYMVGSVTAHHERGVYLFDSFMVYLPTQLDDNFCYDVEAKPKCSEYTPATEYTVTKLWKDSGYIDERPTSVVVDIIKDGVLQETQILNAANNWTYTWRVLDEKGVWSVAEKNLPNGYTVTIDLLENAFVITNTHTTPGDAPQTGDTAAPSLYMLMMSISGLLLLILGIGGKRGKKHE